MGDSLRLAIISLMLALIGATGGSLTGVDVRQAGGFAEEGREATPPGEACPIPESGSEADGESAPTGKTGTGSKLGKGESIEKGSLARRKRRVPAPRLVRSCLVPAVARAPRPVLPCPLVAESFAPGRASARAVYLLI